MENESSCKEIGCPGKESENSSHPVVSSRPASSKRADDETVKVLKAIGASPEVIALAESKPRKQLWRRILFLDD